MQKPQRKINNRFRNYLVNVPRELGDEIEGVAKDFGILAVDVLRQFIKLGLVATNGKQTLYVKNEADEFVELVVFTPKVEEKVTQPVKVAD